MKLIHYSGAPEQSDDEYFKTRPFNTVDLKFSYTSSLRKLKSKLKYSVGVKISQMITKMILIALGIGTVTSFTDLALLDIFI